MHSSVASARRSKTSRTGVQQPVWASKRTIELMDHISEQHCAHAHLQNPEAAQSQISDELC
eukprot:scaffold3330_cov398-Pinguiococcus_pyrenoidosus.AAC.14